MQTVTGPVKVGWMISKRGLKVHNKESQEDQSGSHKGLRREENLQIAVMEEPGVNQCPLIAKGGEVHYVPWSFMDMTG